jgi:hypothetical protein
MCSVIFSQKMVLFIWMPEPRYRMAGQSRRNRWRNGVYTFLGPLTNKNRTIVLNLRFSHRTSEFATPPSSEKALRLGRTYRFRLLQVSCLAYSSFRKIEAIWSSETSGFFRTTGRYYSRGTKISTDRVDISCDRRVTLIAVFSRIFVKFFFVGFTAFL